MNVLMPRKPRGYKKRIALYTLLITVCIVAVGIAIYQFFTNEKLGVIIGITRSSDEEIEELKSNFNNIFTNNVNISKNIKNQDEIEKYKNIVVTDYKQQDKVVNNYDLNVNIPKLSLDDELAKDYNNEIKRSFQEPAQYIKQTQNRSIAYTVNYVATVDDNILSLVILATFKEGNNAQRTMVETYNYNLEKNTEVTIDELIQKKNLDKNKIQNTIKAEINNSQNQAEKLRELGYDIYSRNINDSMYQLQNTTEFFTYNNYLYLIYAYGNEQNTSEMDIVIIK